MPETSDPVKEIKAQMDPKDGGPANEEGNKISGSYLEATTVKKEAPFCV
jgi:hypothetical protein